MDFPDEVVEFVAQQMNVPAADFESYQWTGSTIEYHRAQIREQLGFRVCSVQDAEKLTAWLAGNVALHQAALKQCAALAGDGSTSAGRKAYRAYADRIAAAPQAPAVRRGARTSHDQ